MLMGQPSTDIRLQGNSYSPGTLMGTGLTPEMNEKMNAINQRIESINTAGKGLPSIPGGLPGLEPEPMPKVTPIEKAIAPATDDLSPYPGAAADKTVAKGMSEGASKGVAAGIGIGTGLFNMANVGAKSSSDGRISAPGMKLSTAGTLGSAGATTGNPFLAAGGFLAGGAIDLVNFFKGQKQYRTETRKLNLSDYITQKKADLGTKDYTGYA